MVEQIIPAGAVQLTHDIIQKNDGILPGRFFYNYTLSELQRQDAASLLALRAEASGRVLIDVNTNIIPVGTDEGRSRGDIRIYNLGGVLFADLWKKRFFRS